MIRCDVVPDLEHERRRECFCRGDADRDRADVRTPQNLHRCRRLGRRREVDEVIVQVKGRGERDFRCPAAGHRVCEDAPDGADRRHLRRDKIDSGILRPAARLKIAVEGPQGDAPRVWGEAHADARPAGTFEDARPRCDEIGECSGLCQHGIDLPGAGRDGERHIRCHGPAAQDGGNRQHILHGRIGAGADTYLVDRHPRKLGHRADVVGAVRAGGEGDERREVDRDRLVIHGVGVRLYGAVGSLAPLAHEEFPRPLVGGKEGGRRAELRPHIGDGGALGYGKRLHPRSVVFQNGTDPALYAEAPQDLQDDVLRADPGAELPGEVHADDTRHGDIVGAAPHRHGDVEPPGAHAQRTEPTGGRRVAVGADERLTGHAEAFEMHLVTDAVPRTGETYAVPRGDRAYVTVVVGVFKPRLQGIVVNVGDRELGLHLLRAHGFQLQIRHGTGRVLRQGLVDPDRDLLPDAHLARDEMLPDDLPCECLSHVLSFRFCEMPGGQLLDERLQFLRAHDGGSPVFI